MAASFPNAKKTFTQVVNGVTKLVAALFNSPYDEIEAIETMLGAMGSTQANSDSYRNLIREYRRGVDVIEKSTADIYVKAGELVIADASGNLRFRRNTADLTVAWTDIDTGSEANSTQYYVYALADASGTTFTAKISASDSAPSGATFYRKIGSFYNNSSGDIQQVYPINTDKDPLFVDRGNAMAFDLIQSSMTIDSGYHDWDLSSIVPAGAKAVALVITAVNTQAGITMYFRKNGDSSNYNIGGLFTQVANLSIRQDIIVPCDSNRVIEYYVQNTGTWSTIAITVKGWWR